MKNMINAVTTVQPTNLEIPLWRLMTLVGVVVGKDDMSALIVAINFRAIAINLTSHGFRNYNSCIARRIPNLITRIHAQLELLQ